MAEKLLEKPICQACGADVRQYAQFCYSCGSSVAQAEKENTGNNGKPDVRLREEVAGGKSAASPEKIEAAEKPIEKPAEDFFALPVGNKLKSRNEDLAENKSPPLKTAAAIRKQNRRAEKKRVEIVWEEPRNSANILFIIVSLFLLLVAVVILMAMLYIR
jgi:hypothetical protein